MTESLFDVVGCNTLGAYFIRKMMYCTNLPTAHDLHSNVHYNLRIERTPYTYSVECDVLTSHGVGIKEKRGALALL